MALTITVTANYTFPAGRPITLAALRKAAAPSVSITGSVAAGDLAAGAVTAAKSTPDAYWYGAATGTDTYAVALSPALTAYANGVRVRVKFANANTSLIPTLNVNSLGAKPISYHIGSTLAGSFRPGTIGTNSILSLTYNSSLDSGNGGFEIDSERIPDTAVVAAARNLVVKSNAAAPTTTIDITADEVVLKATNQLPHVASPNLTVLITAGGANGLDTGAEAASTWYYVFVIYNATTATVAGLLSLSATAPTMPAGYTYKALVGVVRNDGSSNIVAFHQRDRKAWQIQSVVFTAKDAAVADTWEILAGADLTAFQAAVPPIATACDGVIGSSNTAEACAVGLGAVNADGTLASAVIGAQQFHVSAYGAAMDTFAACTPFANLPVRGGASYNIQWKSRLTTDSVRLVINGFTI